MAPVVVVIVTGTPAGTPFSVFAHAVIVRLCMSSLWPLCGFEMVVR